MGSITTMVNTEVAILNRLFQADRGQLPTTAAKALLKINFTDSDRQKMRELSLKAREGSLTPQEQIEIDSYEVVGHLLGLLHSKAQRSMKK